MKSKKTLILFAILILVFGIYFYINKREISVNTYKINEQEIIDAIYSTGTITSEKKANIKSNVSGIITLSPIKSGYVVKNNQILVKINNDKQNLQVADARSNILQNEASIKELESNLKLIKAGNLKEDINSSKENINQAKSELKKLELELNRKKALLKQEAIAKSEVDDLLQQQIGLKSKIRAAENQNIIIQKGNRPEEIEMAEEKLISAKAKLEQSNILLDKTLRDLKDYAILAPFSGIISDYNLQKGDTVTIGSSIATILDPKYFQVKTQIDEVDILRVKKGQKALIALDADNEKILNGVVERIIPKTDLISKTCEIIINFEKLPSNLIEGMTASVNIITQKRKGFTIPITSIIRDGDKNFVWKITNENKIQKIEIFTGVQDGKKIELKKTSLKKGELIVVENSSNLKDGRSVKFKAE